MASRSTSLNVLADVAASSTLTSPPCSAKNKRAVLSASILHLDDIRTLNDHNLIKLFSELNCDEIKRQYSYKCHLIPSVCSRVFSSYGNEMRARQMMQEHLTAHIADLVSKAKSTKVKFTAEPLTAKRKRLKAQKDFKRQEIKQKKSTQYLKQKDHKQLSLCGTKYSAAENDLCKSKNKVKNKTSAVICDKNGRVRNTSNSRKKKLNQSGNSKTKIDMLCHEHMFHSDEDKEKNDENANSTEMLPKDNDVCAENNASFRVRPDVIASEDEMPKLNDVPSHVHHSQSDSMQHHEDKSKGSCNAGSISSVPGDHNYILCSDKDNVRNLKEERWSTTENSPVFDIEHYLSQSEPPVIPKVISSLPFPFVYVPAFPNVGQIISVVLKKKLSYINRLVYETADYANLSTTRNKKIIKSNDIPILADFRSRNFVSKTTSDPDSSNNNNSSSNGTQPAPMLRSNDVKTVLWEKRYAMMCLRKLKQDMFKKKRNNLHCEICGDSRLFSAPNTLMFHYKSHAGIRPYECDICGTTFTRRHSLKYHMLIHSNQSRFTCEECGHKFRHPSHFKEHLRTHTGECPYECSDCGFSFKSRNTYKRHLKISHGKLLTADGIIILSKEDYQKMRNGSDSYRKLLNQFKKIRQWTDPYLDKKEDL